MEYSKEQLLAMGIIEYATKVLKLKLTNWQVTYLKNMQTNPLPADSIFKNSGHLYGPRACYLVYERWKNRVTDYPNNELP